MTVPHGCQPGHDAERQRLLDLLAERAVQGLTLVESAELQRLQASHPGLVDESLERVAAALDLALGPQRFDPLPPSLAAKVREAGAEWAQARSQSAHTLRPRESSRPSVGSRAASFSFEASRGSEPVHRDRRDSRWPARFGWLAAAACLLLALVAWWPRLSLSTSPDASQLRAQLIERGGDVVQINWRATGDQYGLTASGDVLWSPKFQQGVMRFRGMQPNDPSQFQYQLWIFDATRDERYPVDGGVFDIAPAHGGSISGTGEVDVIIDPKLDVRDAMAFAITVESPGGTTVSDRKHIVVLAPMTEAKPLPRGSSAGPTSRGGTKLHECEGAPAGGAAASGLSTSVSTGGT